MPLQLLRAVRYRLQVAGFPYCHEQCARNYFMVIYSLGPGSTSYKMGLN